MAERTDAKRHLLVVDDEEAIVELLSRVLRRAGYRVTTASDGMAAWQFFEAHQFDMVISDLKLPKLDGEQLVRRIKALSPNTPIIMLTGHGHGEIKERLLALGVARVLAKPLEEIRDIVTLVGRLCPPEL